ncbi:MAG: hypothetical protein RI900_1911 [Actinomycetota bacterium]|jgi:RNA polymerase sigma factor (sigma-70 family)
MVMDSRDEELYAKHAEELIRFATTLVGPAMAEDLTTSSFLSAVSSPAWKGVSEPRAYLFRVVLNQSRSIRRADRRRAAREHAAAQGAEVEPSTLSFEVRDAISRLSLDERSVLYLAYWLDFPVSEIAEVLGMSRRTVERSLTRARRQLEELLA